MANANNAQAEGNISQATAKAVTPGYFKLITPMGTEALFENQLVSMGFDVLKRMLLTVGAAHAAGAFEGDEFVIIPDVLTWNAHATGTKTVEINGIEMPVVTFSQTQKGQEWLESKKKESKSAPDAGMSEAMANTLRTVLDVGGDA